MKNFYLFLLMPVILLFAQQDEWQTFYEKSGFLETPRYDETIAFCNQLANASPMISYQTFGVSPQGRDLPLLIVNKNGQFTPEEIRNSGQIVFLIQAGIHAGEIDGKDAGFQLIRDMVFQNKNKQLLDNVTILFIPIFNVDGHERFGPYNRANQNGPKEMGWRTTAQNLNLNRDYLKADAPEMQAWLKLYTKWLPEFFADCHVTDGADYQYVLTYKMETHGIQDAGLIKWTKVDYLPELHKKMNASGFPMMEYVYLRKAHDLLSGMTTWAAPPRFSDGYTAIQNRLGLLIETHMFKNYKNRVDATYKILLHTLEILNVQHSKLKSMINIADELCASAEFRSKPYTVTYKNSSDSTMIDFMGFEYDKINSDLTGGDWFRFYDDKPKTFHIPFFNKMDADIAVDLPLAYIIPVEWQEIIKRMELHGIKIKRLQSNQKLSVDSYRFENVKWATGPFEGRFSPQFKLVKIQEKRVFPKGSAVVLMNQRTAKVVANILEPQASDSYLGWGFFNAIFERKEYIESYVMEEYARKMLAEDRELAIKFETEVKNNPDYSDNPRAILMWLYQHSPFWDTKKDVYPVGKIFDKNVLQSLNCK